MALDLHFVAFIDILGFADMVRSDCEGPPDEAENFTRLREVHEATRARLGAVDDCGLVQFSDSVVLSRLYQPEAFRNFILLVAGFQRDLLLQRLLCRGGVAYGKHHSEGSFMFSQGLISAYRLEQEARYPRILVSQDLLDLLVPRHVAAADLPLLRADDGSCFVHYVDDELLAVGEQTAQDLLASKPEPSVLEKAIWLAKYVGYVKGQPGIAPAPFETIE